MTARKGTKKPAKPYPDFPLTPHANGSWVKVHQGKQIRFGRWDDHKAALANYLKWRESIEAGFTPTRIDGAYDIGDLVDDFMDAKQAKSDAGDLKPRRVDELHTIGKWLVAHFGEHRPVESLRPEDFAKLRATFPESWGTVSITHRINDTRSFMKWAYENGKIDKPIRFGDTFSKPSRRRQRLEKASKPKKMFSAAEIHKLIDAADVQLRCMILLGVNCGYGNADCSRLTIEAATSGVWLREIRGKTGEARSAWLWHETRKAIENVLAFHEASNVKTKPGCEHLLFRTHHGREWVDEVTKRDGVCGEFNKLRKTVKVERRGVGFYSLRHVAETIGGECGDQVAVNHLMGHVDDSMAATYREEVSDHRMRKVCQHIREWYLGGAK